MSQETMVMEEQALQAVEEGQDGGPGEAPEGGEVATLRARLLAQQARMAQLEGEVEGCQRDLEAKQAELASREADVQSLQAELKLAVEKYRESLLATMPGVPSEMLGGETVAEVERSATLAREMVARVREQIEAEAAAGRVPAGAPPRGVPDVSGMSAQEKIAYALRRHG